MFKINIKIRQSIIETFKLLYQFKWYIFPYILFYLLLLSFYLSPSPKQYNIWMNEVWFVYNQSLYLALTKLMLIMFALLFLVGTSKGDNYANLIGRLLGRKYPNGDCNELIQKYIKKTL